MWLKERNIALLESREFTIAGLLQNTIAASKATASSGLHGKLLKRRDEILLGLSSYRDLSQRDIFRHLLLMVLNMHYVW